MRSSANFITWIFSPLSMPLLALLLTLYLPTEIDFNTIVDSHFYLNNTIKRLLFNAFALFIWIFPILSILLIRATRIRTYEHNYQQTHKWIFILISIYAFMLSMVLFRFDQQITLPLHLFSLSFSICFLSLFFAFLPTRSQISVYGCSIGVFIGFIFAYYTNQTLLIFWPLYLCCCFLGSLLSINIYLNKNTLSATTWGAVLGFISTFVINILFIIIYN